MDKLHISADIPAVVFAAAAVSALAAVVHLPTLWYNAVFMHLHMFPGSKGCKEQLTLRILTAQPELNDASVCAEIIKRHWELAVAVHGSDAAALDAGAFGVAHRMVCSCLRFSPLELMNTTCSFCKMTNQRRGCRFTPLRRHCSAPAGARH